MDTFDTSDKLKLERHDHVVEYRSTEKVDIRKAEFLL